METKFQRTKNTVFTQGEDNTKKIKKSRAAILYKLLK